MPDHARALRGDESALYEQHAALLIRHVRGAVTTSEAIVQDACANAWAILLRRQPTRGDTLFAWLRVVAIREAIRMDRRARADTSLDQLAEMPERADTEAEGKQRPTIQVGSSDEPAIRARDALRLLAQLPPRARRIFALHVAGYSYAEIGELTGDSLRTVDRQMSRARQHVRWPQS